MIRFNIVVLGVIVSLTAVACGGSQAPAKDPSDAAAAPEATTPPPAPPPGQPGLGLGGTGTGSAQGATSGGH